METRTTTATRDGGLPPPLSTALARGDQALDESCAKELIAAYGIAVPRGAVFANVGEVGRVLPKLPPPPWVAKALSRAPIHKSDIGALKLGLQTPAELRVALEDISAAVARHGHTTHGFLVEEMIAGGTELVIGAARNTRFGPVIMFGMGGIFVEVLQDIAFRICPIVEADAREMIGDLRCAPLLGGLRGHAPVSEDTIVDTLLRIGGEAGLFVQLFDAFEEIDLNPLIVRGPRAVALDARFVLRRSGP